MQKIRDDVFVIDGSYFMPALPSLDLITSIAVAASAKDAMERYDPDILSSLDDAYACWKLIRGNSGRDQMGVAKSWRLMGKEDFAFVLDEYWVCRDMDKADTLLWRPVLIPVTREADRDTNIEFQDGERVTGCSLYVDGVEREVTTEKITGKEFRIGDTGDHPMEWFWWNGVMVSLFSACVISCENLVKNRLVGPCTTEGYDERYIYRMQPW